MESVDEPIIPLENPIVQYEKRIIQFGYLCCDERERNLELEDELHPYLHNRFGCVFAAWLQDVFVGRFKCIDPDAHRAHEIGVWGCRIDASKLRYSIQKPELERRTVEYTQKYMGQTFADFLNHVFCGHIQQGFVDDRSGEDMIVILTQPLYLLMEVDDKRSAGLAVVPFTDGDLSRPGVFLSEGAPNAPGRSSEASCSHKQCADCGRVLTPDTCFECNLRVCRNCSNQCEVCKKTPLCKFCIRIYRHRCLPKRLPPGD